MIVVKHLEEYRRQSVNVSCFIIAANNWLRNLKCSQWNVLLLDQLVLCWVNIILRIDRIFGCHADTTSESLYNA